MDTLVLDTEVPPVVKLHPMVMFGIMDHHLRRTKGVSRVIGLLLGHRSGSIIEVSNYVPTPHTEDESDVRFSSKKIDTIVDIRKRINPSETPVGWYLTVTSTETDPVEFSLPLHSHFSNKYGPQLVHLSVDLTLREDRVQFNAFQSKQNPILAGRAHVYQQVKVTVEASEAERIALHTLLHSDRAPPSTAAKGWASGGGAAASTPASAAAVAAGGAGGGKRGGAGGASSPAPASSPAAAGGSTPSSSGSFAIVGKGTDGSKGVLESRVSTLGSDMEALQASIHRVHDMLCAVTSYVVDVNAGRKPADPLLGRAIAEALSSVPRIEPGSFERMFNGALQDALIAVYLGNLTRTQVVLADRMVRSLPLR